MHGCKIVRKDGSEVRGTLWALNRASWHFEVTDDETGHLIEVPVAECASAVLYGGRRTAGTAGQDEDLMQRARDWGWKDPSP